MPINYQRDIVDSFFASRLTVDQNYQSPGVFGLPMGFSDLHLETATRSAGGGGYVVNDVISFLGGTATTPARLVVASITAPYTLVDGSIALEGSGYTASDVLTVDGGTFTTAATIIVDAVDDVTGEVLTYHVDDGGSYTVLPDGAVSVTGGTGTGFSLNPVWGGAVDTFTVGEAGTYQGVPDNPISTDSSGFGTGFTVRATWSSSAGQRLLAFVDLFSSYVSAMEQASEAKVVSEVLSKMLAALKLGSNFNGSQLSENARSRALKHIANHNTPAPFDPSGESGGFLAGSIWIGPDKLGNTGYLYNAPRAPGIVNGLNPLMPAHAPAGVLSFWYNFPPGGSQGGNVFTVRDQTGAHILFQVALGQAGYLFVTIGDGTDANTVQFTSVGQPIRFDGGWHNLQIAWDMSISSIVASFLTVQHDVLTVSMKNTGLTNSASTTIPWLNNYYLIGTDITNITPVYGVGNTTIAALGTGYRVGDKLQIRTGTYTLAAEVRVDTVNGSGGITAYTITNRGQYSVKPLSPVALVPELSVAGLPLSAGTGAALNITSFTVITGAMPYAPRFASPMAGNLAEFWFSPFGSKVDPRPLNEGGTATYMLPNGLPVLISGAYLARRAPNGNMFAGNPGIDGNLPQMVGHAYPNFGFTGLPLLGCPPIFMHGNAGEFMNNHNNIWSLRFAGGNGPIQSSRFLPSSGGSIHTGASSPLYD